jgi:hypothetical protein
MGASAEDGAMAPSHSVTRWLEQLKEGDRQAVGPLWERYFTRLVFSLPKCWPLERLKRADEIPSRLS